MCNESRPIKAFGTLLWYKIGTTKLHRTDGPAIVWDSDHRIEGGWYVNDEEIDINPILERLDISSDWRSWTDMEKMIVRLALP